MTLTTDVDSRHSADREAMRRCAVCCRYLGKIEFALPAPALRNNAVAKWVGDHDVTVAVRSSADLGVAIGAGIHPMRMTVHANGLTANELVFCSANLGVGRMVTDTAEQIGLLTSSTVRHRRQRVLVDVAGIDTVVAVLAGTRLDLVGVYCEITSREPFFVSYPAAVGDMLATMADIHCKHGIVLTRAVVGGGRFVFDEHVADLSELASAIEETVDDACATLRFPRPVVVVSASDGASV